MAWYVAHIILSVEWTEGAQSYFPVWENIHLLEGRDKNEVLRRAEEIGRESAAVEDETFTWEGRRARWVFQGVRKILEAGDRGERPVSGTELSFSELSVADLESLQKLVAGKSVRLDYVE